MSIGHSIEDIKLLMKEIGTTDVNDVVKFLRGKNFADAAQIKVLEKLGGVGSGAGGVGSKVARMAGSKAFNTALRAVPIVGTGLAALDVADVVAGGDSLANKGMDATAMTIGGILGAPGGPLGIAAGASLGKGVSDITQMIFGGGKSAEDRKIEEALKALRAKGVI